MIHQFSTNEVRGRSAAGRRSTWGAALLAPFTGAFLLSGCAGYDPWDYIPDHGGSSSGGSSSGGTAGSAGSSSGGAAGTGMGGGGGVGGAPAACVVDGVLHLPGSSFPSPDGCNDCFCDEGGLTVCTLRACVDTCGGLLGLQCGDDQFCDFPPEATCGAADQTGVCSERPEVCTEEFDPVCGCDGETYPNACFAAMAGVSVAEEGECGGEPFQCRSDRECPQPICECIDVDGDGTCDNTCPTLGCRDGQCVDITPPGSQCGGLLGESCPPDQFCYFPLEASCGAADQTGTCKQVPEVCTFEFNPVCGCDGETYDNPCFAAASGVSIAEPGECEGGGEELGLGDACGGFRLPGAPDCADGLFCQHQPGALCGAADAPGECVAIPDVCAEVIEPVCGCDGETYANACEAAAAQVGILETGECEGGGSSY